MRERSRQQRTFEPLKPPGYRSKVQYVVFAVLLAVTAYLVFMALQKP